MRTYRRHSFVSRLIRSVQNISTERRSYGIAKENSCTHLELLKEVLKGVWQGGMEDLSYDRE